MLSKETIIDLNHERDRLQSLMDLLPQRLEAIETLLCLNIDVCDTPAFYIDEVPSVSLNQTPIRRNGNGKPLFSAAIRETLQEFGRSARPKQVAQALEEKGFKNPRSCTFSAAVNGELVRMAKHQIGGVRRVRKGFYKIYPENQNGTGSHNDEAGPKVQEEQE